MAFTIQIHYQTGNSFGSHNEQDNIELSWENLAIAKANLTRIKEHYLYYQAKHNYYARWKPELDKSIINTASTKPWYCKEYGDHGLMLQLDDGSEHMVCAFWCGYFEKLFTAEVVPDFKSESDWRIDF